MATKNPRGNASKKKQESKDGKLEAKPTGPKNPRTGGAGTKNVPKPKSKTAAKPNPRPKKRVNATEVGVMKATPAKRRMTEPKGKASTKTVSASKPKKKKKNYQTSRTTKDFKKRENR